MTANLNPILWNAILSMDSYNRGYEAGIALDSPDQTIGKQLGKYNIIAHSSDLLDEGGNTGIDQPIGFYALAYDYNGETIIAYRGTNYPDHEEGRYDDITQGSTLGAGFYTADQGIMAIGSYGRIGA